MKLSDNYEITVDERNVILRHYVAPVEKFHSVDGVKVSKGMSKGHWEVCGYYRTHQAALRAWMNMELRETPQSVTELLGKLDEVMKVIGGLEIDYTYQCNYKGKTEVSDD